MSEIVTEQIRSAEFWRNSKGWVQQKLPLDETGKTFRRNWFKKRNQVTFSTYLTPRFDGTFPVQLLQIGVFEGMDLLWQHQNTLTHNGSFSVGVDPWLGTPKFIKRWGAEEAQKFMDQTMRNAIDNLHKQPCVLHRALSHDKLPELAEAGQTFNLIVIDGDHRADAVYQDMKDSLALSRPGTWWLMDDAENRVRKKDHVRHGIDRFLKDFPGVVELVWKHKHCECYQVI